MEYVVVHAPAAPELTGQWEGPAWGAVAPLPVGLFHPQSSGHRPQVQAKLAYDAAALHVIFRVADRYVRCVHTHDQDPVCTDSCVELFVEPKPGAGYFNFEINAGGTVLLYHVRDARRTPQGFADFSPVDSRWLRQLRIYHSLPAVVEPELAGPVEWTLEYSIPLALFEAHVGPLGALPGQTWRGNLFKCGDATSHPHWASWAPIGAPLNFHQPDRFAPLVFA